MTKEVIFEIREDETEGGFVATALGYDIFTEADSIEELRLNVRNAIQCHFADGTCGEIPKVIRLHYVKDEVLAT